MVGCRLLLLPLLLLLLPPVRLTASAAAVSGVQQQPAAPDDATREQLACLASYVRSKGRRKVDIYIDCPVSDATVALLLRLLSAQLIFARLTRGRPPVPPRPDAAGRLPSQVIWFAPDADSPELTHLMGRVRGDQSLAWLLVSLGSRPAHFLRGFAPRHHYMIREGDSAVFYSGWRFHTSNNSPAMVCVGDRVERRSYHAVTQNMHAMEGVHVRLLYMEPKHTATSSPSLMQQLHVQHQNGTITGGLVGSVILLLQDVLGFTYSLIPVRVGPNTSVWDQAVIELGRGHGDLLAGRLLYSARRARQVDFSHPFMVGISGAVIDTRYTQTLSDFPVTVPLRPGVWWALFGTQLVAVFVLSLIARCQLRLRRPQLDEPADEADPSFWALLFLGVLCQQGAVVRSDGAASYRVAISALYLLSLFIFACYSGNLLAHMTLGHRKMPFASLSDALDDGWRVSQEGMSLALQETVVDPLFRRPLSAEEKTRDGPLDGKNLLMLTGTNTDHVYNCSGDGVTQPDQCPVCMWPGDVKRQSYSLVSRRRFPYMRLINYMLPRLLDRGIVSRQLRRWRPRDTNDLICPLNTVTLKKTHLGLDNLKYMFAIVIAGLLGSIGVLLLERVVFALWMVYTQWKLKKQVVLFIHKKTAGVVPH